MILVYAVLLALGRTTVEMKSQPLRLSPLNYDYSTCRMVIAHVSTKQPNVGGVKTIKTKIYINCETRLTLFSPTARLMGFSSSFNIYSVNMRYDHLGVERAPSHEPQCF